MKRLAGTATSSARRSAAGRPGSALALALLVASVACAGPPDSAGGLRQPRFRFLPEDPEATPSRDALYDVTELFEWRPGPNGACLPIWPAHEAVGEVELSGRVVPLETVEDRARLTLDWPDRTSEPPEMARVDRFDVELVSRHPTSTRTGDVAVYWAGRGERMSNRRSLVEVHGTLGPDGRRHYRLAMATHAGWNGRPRRLRWAFVAPTTGEPVALCAIKGVAETLPPTRIAPWTRTGWKGVLGGQIRNALPAVPSLPVRREVEVPRAAELRLSFGAPGGAGGDLDFEVWVRPVRGERELAFRATLESGEGFDRWHDAVVDLGRFGGATAEISLELAAASELDLVGGIPLWGSPEIVAP